IARKLDRSKEHHKAFIAAWDAQQDFESTLRKRGEEVLSKLDAKAQALVIVSRSYNGCDPGINLRIPRILRDMGVIAIPIDMLPLDAVDTVAKWRGMYWGYGQKILAAAQIIKNDPRLFAVYITNFSCGPDSFISHFFRKELAEKPYLQIEIDEHSADAGVVTRLEAFLDSLKNIRLSEALKVSPPQLTILRSTNGKKKTVYIPYMTDHVYALAAAFHACGTPAEVMPESDSETVTVGRKYTSGRECYPCILTIGNMVKMVNRPDIDPERTAFFMPNTNGPCRFGQYYHFQRLVLDDLGYPDISFHSFNQDDGIYGDCEIVGNDFARLAWQGIVAIDLLEKKLREVRPYEINNGEADQIYRHYLNEITECIKRKANLTKVLQEARDEFDHLSIDGELMKPVIGLVGEIYIRTNRFGNENIVRELEALGSEVWLPSVGEWILYTNFTAMRNSITNRRWKNFLKILINNRYQRYYEHHLSKVLAPSLKNCSEPSTKEVLQYAEPYLDPTFEGEAILSVGKAVDFAKKGVDGIINVMPFTCMPGTIVNTLLKKFREMEGNIPVLNISYDGQKQTNTRTRLEAFVYQVCQFQKSGARRSPNVARDQKPEKHQSFHL
ncbi:MAG: CoA activase, partial [Deltaproteobacteria bacterium]|nr:CoA activase [Deltaproteobacteria bacterium]